MPYRNVQIGLNSSFGGVQSGLCRFAYHPEENGDVDQPAAADAAKQINRKKLRLRKRLLAAATVFIIPLDAYCGLEFSILQPKIEEANFKLPVA